MYGKSAELSRLMMVISSKQKKILNRLIRELGYDFDFAHFKLLLTISHHPGEVYAKNLAEFEDKSKSTINVLLKKMESLELIEIVPKLEDKRHKIITITQTGKDTYIHIAQNIEQAIFPKIVENISIEEQEVAHRVLLSLLGNLDDILGEQSNLSI